MDKTQIGVFLLGFGAPDNLGAVEPFLRSVFSSQGKALPPSVFDKYLEETIKRYEAIGGRSPYLDITRSQAQALERRLNKEGSSFKVYVGMRNWHPYIKQAVSDVVNDDVEKIVVLSLSPQHNRATVASNVRELKLILNQANFNREVVFVDSWHDNPTYLDAFSDKVKQGLSQISKAKKEQVTVLFSAHSLPKRLVEQGDPYLSELNGTIAGVLTRVGKLRWELCFQSRGSEGEWLEPDIKSVVNRLGRKGCDKMLIAPVSFITDNIEILYDIDIVLRKQATDVGVTMFKRIDSLNTSPKFIEALAQIVLERV